MQATAAGVTLPSDAQTHVPPPDLRLEWDNSAAALAADWHDFEDEGALTGSCPSACSSMARC